MPPLFLRKQAPGFVLSVDLWLQDPSIRILPYEQRGILAESWCLAWRGEPRATLPNDAEGIGRLLQLDPKRWAKVRGSILPFWVLPPAIRSLGYPTVPDDNRLRNPFLWEAHEYALALSTTRKAAARARWNKDQSKAPES